MKKLLLFVTFLLSHTMQAVHQCGISLTSSITKQTLVESNENTRLAFAEAIMNFFQTYQDDLSNDAFNRMLSQIRIEIALASNIDVRALPQIKTPEFYCMASQKMFFYPNIVVFIILAFNHWQRQNNPLNIIDSGDFLNETPAVRQNQLIKALELLQAIAHKTGSTCLETFLTGLAHEFASIRQSPTPLASEKFAQKLVQNTPHQKLTNLYFKIRQFILDHRPTISEN